LGPNRINDPPAEALSITHINGPMSLSDSAVSLSGLPECTACGRCCYLPVPINPRLEPHLPDSAFQRSLFSPTGWILARRPNGSCEALNEATQLCGRYDERPTICRTFARGNGACRNLNKLDKPEATSCYTIASWSGRFAVLIAVNWILYGWVIPRAQPSDAMCLPVVLLCLGLALAIGTDRLLRKQENRRRRLAELNSPVPP